MDKGDSACIIDDLAKVNRHDAGAKPNLIGSEGQGLAQSQRVSKTGAVNPGEPSLFDFSGEFNRGLRRPGTAARLRAGMRVMALSPVLSGRKRQSTSRTQLYINSTYLRQRIGGR